MNCLSRRSHVCGRHTAWKRGNRRRYHFQESVARRARSKRLDGVRGKSVLPHKTRSGGLHVVEHPHKLVVRKG
eukprot:scaffold207667_cov29-Tisochrysis_lutea.AAC.2